ncbi:MAG: family transcriptional regulator, partial [Frondihabitans sp.]|nr:family transcriptional regulator [Frondihabitans sp.]
LAAASQLSHPFLSQLERGLARPSLVSLERIARALASSQIELLAAVDDDVPDEATTGGAVGHRQAPVSLVRATEGSRGTYGKSEARLLVHGRRRFHPMEITGDDSDAGDYFSHDEDEFIHVVEGTVVADLGDQGVHVLTTGDSLYFDAGTLHRWSAPKGSFYRMFVVKEKPATL